MKRYPRLSCFLFLIFAVSSLFYLSGCLLKATSSQTYLIAGQLIDGRGGRTLKNAVVVMDGQHIVQILERIPSKFPGGGRVVHAENSTVMPGLINVHTHIMSAGECKWIKGFSFDQLYRNLKITVAEGVTTVVDLASSPPAIRAVKKWAEKHPEQSPRVLYAGPFLTAPGGYPMDWLPEEFKKFGGAEEIKSVEDVPALMKKLVEEYDVDVIKAGVVEKSFNFKPINRLSSEMLNAIVREAHKYNRRVFVHATYDHDYKIAAEAGVDVIAHGCLEPLTGNTAETLKKNGTFVAPTLRVFMALTEGKTILRDIENTPLQNRLSPAVIDDLRAYVKEYEVSEFVPHAIKGIKKDLAPVGTKNSMKNLKTLFDKGVPIAVGTDAAYCFNFHGSPYKEMELMVKAGLMPMDVIVSATQNSARAAGIDKITGTLEPGKKADILIVKGDPLKDISAIKNVERVFRDGKEVNVSKINPTFRQKISLAFPVAKAMLPVLLTGKK